MKRTAITACWLLTLLGAFLLGRQSAEQPSLPTSEPVVAAGQPSELRTASTAEPVEHEDPVRVAETLTADGRPLEAVEVLLAHLADNAHDERALFLLSDLRQMTGEVELALEPLFAILRFPSSPEIAVRARKRLDLLVTAREQQLINAGDLVALVAYFEALVLAEPGYDGHRLKLVRWLLRSGEVDAAARLFKEVGLVGVAQPELDALAREIALARTALPVEQVRGAMYTNAVVTGPRRSSEFRFLIDTGATMSGAAVSRLEGLGAARVDEGIRVQTANGVAVLPVYRISELKLGALVLRDMNVLGFTDLPPSADGLLGMDVLSRLSGGVPTAVGRP